MILNYESQDYFCLTSLRSRANTFLGNRLLAYHVRLWTYLKKVYQNVISATAGDTGRGLCYGTF